MKKEILLASRIKEESLTKDRKIKLEKMMLDRRSIQTKGLIKGSGFKEV